MGLRGPSATLQRADATNRSILQDALVSHDKHYWNLCRWIEGDLSNKRTRIWQSGPEAICQLLGEGATAATVIWETYARQQEKSKP